MKKRLLIMFVLIIALTISLLNTSVCFAEEEIVEANEAEVVEAENGGIAVYEEAKETATEITEKLNLRETLSKYFDEHMVELIISIVVIVIAVAIIFSEVIFLVIKLKNSIKKYGVESEATKEIANKLKAQLSETSKALNDIEELKNNIEANKEELKAEYDKIIKVLDLAFTNDVDLVQRGFATKIKETIEEK